MNESSGSGADGSRYQQGSSSPPSSKIENVMDWPSCDVEFSNTWYVMYVAIIKIRVIQMSKLEVDETMITKMATTLKSHFCNSMTVRSIQTAVDLQVVYGPIMNA